MTAPSLATNPGKSVTGALFWLFWSLLPCFQRSKIASAFGRVWDWSGFVRVSSFFLCSFPHGQHTGATADRVFTVPPDRQGSSYERGAAALTNRRTMQNSHHSTGSPDHHGYGSRLRLRCRSPLGRIFLALSGRPIPEKAEKRARPRRESRLIHSLHSGVYVIRSPPESPGPRRENQGKTQTQDRKRSLEDSS